MHHDAGTHWDAQKPNPQQRDVCFTYCNLMNTSEKSVWVEYAPVRQMEEVGKALVDAKYADVHDLFFWKHDQNGTGLHKYIWAMGTAVIGYRPSWPRWIGLALPIH